MKALVLGSGEMGRFAIQDLVTHHVFTDVVVACRHPNAAQCSLAELPPSSTRTSIREVDVHDSGTLVACMKEFDVVCNMAGPNFRNAVPVAKAAIAAGVPLVDVSDDWEATLEILGLHEHAARAGITIIVGLGASPGVTNIMARYGASKLDRVDEVHTAWIMRGSDLGGPALCAHLLYSLPHRAFVFEEKQMREVRPFVDGKETLDFPELGSVEVTHIGHPEPFTLSRYIEGVRYADDKATFLPTQTNDLILELGSVGRSGTKISREGRAINSLDSAAQYLYDWGRELTDEPKTGALRTEVCGELEGRRTRIVYSAAGRIGSGTGVPAAIGAQLLAIGTIKKYGVFPPEASIDPEWFFGAVSTRDIGDVNEEVIQE